MDGKNDEGKQKTSHGDRLKEACDVGCQTELNVPPKYHDSPSKNFSTGSNPGVEGGSSSLDSGLSTYRKVNDLLNAEKNKIPAGLKSNSMPEYCADKQNNVPGIKVPKQNATGVVETAKKNVKTGGVPQQAGSSSTANNTTNSVKADGPYWLDDNNKLRLVINNFSHLDETVCSEAKSVEGVSWKIMVMPKQHMVQKKQQKCLGFFLQCSPEKAYSDHWSVHAIADMRMISYKPNVQHFARRTTHIYTSKENDWGYSCFMTWADILDESQGYIRDDTVILEIAVKADAPKNMMSHEDFLEKIEKWIVLADMQMKKGNIDLALEANQNGMKFCKGKDEECYKRLEKQKATFVNAKLIESIDRIEKGKTPIACTDASHGKPTSLRQALTGAQKTLNGKMTAKGGKKTRAVVTVQHMKKKKPNINTNTTQNRNGSNTTVKDLVENRKNSKTEEVSKLNETVVLNTEDENDINQKKEESNENSVSEDKEAVYLSDEEDDEDYDDEEVYNEGDYVDQALDMNNVSFNQVDGLFEPYEIPPEQLAVIGEKTEWSSSCEDLIEAHNAILTENMLRDNLPLYQGQNDAGITVCDRNTQTETTGTLGISDHLNQTDPGSTVQTEHPPLKKTKEDEDGSIEQEDEEEDEECDETFTLQNTDPIGFYYFLYQKTNTPPPANFGLPDFKPPEEFERIFKDRLAQAEEMNKRLGLKANMKDTRKGLAALTIDDVPVNFNLLPGYEMVFSQAIVKDIRNAKIDEGLLKRWFDIERVLLSKINENSVISHLSEEDRGQLIEEIKLKFYPLIATLDNEFRDSVSSAQAFLTNAKKLYGEGQSLMNDCEFIRQSFETFHDKIQPVVKKDSKTGGESLKEKTVTSAAATSGSKSNAKGRTTVIAKRSIKASQYSPAAERALDVNDINLPLITNGTIQEIKFGMRILNQYINHLMSQFNVNVLRVRQAVSDTFADDGILKYFKEFQRTSLNDANRMNQEINTLKSQTKDLNNEKTKLEATLSEHIHALQLEMEKQTKITKEVKDLKNQLKKAESRATKEENRATSIQIQLNEVDEKAKALRKELETLKKKSAEEKTKVKREKDNFNVLMRQQANEITERENERDRLKKDLDDNVRQKNKLEKERQHLGTQLNNVTERAKIAECLILESRLKASLELVKNRKVEVLAGFNETEQNLNRVRQASDRDLLRKSLNEWKVALEKCDAALKSTQSDYDHAIEQVKNGVKSLAQVGELKSVVFESLPKLVKPPPVQIVAPSSAASVSASIQPPISAPSPAIGVIGQPRTPVANRNSKCSSNETATSSSISACSTPQRRLHSPIGTPSKSVASASGTNSLRTSVDEQPISSLWSWNTIADFGASSLNPTFESLQTTIWGPSITSSLEPPSTDFLRQSSSTATLSSVASSPSPYIRTPMPSQQQLQQQQQQPQQPQANLHRIRGLGELWGNNQQQQTPSSLSQQSNQIDSGYGRGMPPAMGPTHNGSGDHHNLSGNSFGTFSPNTSTWRQPPMGNQMHPHQQNHPHNPYNHPFYDGGM